MAAQRYPKIMCFKLFVGWIASTEYPWDSPSYVWINWMLLWFLKSFFVSLHPHTALTTEHGLRHKAITSIFLSIKFWFILSIPWSCAWKLPHLACHGCFRHLKFHTASHYQMNVHQKGDWASQTTLFQGFRLRTYVYLWFLDSDLIL